ncbi:MAG: hypothetical protein SVU32_09465 [Candidatus Nanohaloarchaea archaeon]|nr:hypothetical protein [Candidatus Nanohaloarchaea archaeon]
MPRTGVGTVSERGSGLRHGPVTRTLVLASIFFLIGFTAAATQVANQEEVIDLGEPTEVRINISYVELSSEKVSLLVPSSHTPKNIVGRDPLGRMSCSYNEVEREITCTPNRQQADRRGLYNVSITYTTENPSTDRGGYLSLTHVRHVLVPMDHYTLTVILPEGYGTVDAKKMKPFTPEAEAGSEGRRIFVRWTRDDLSLGQTLRFTVRYQELEVFEDVFPGRAAFFAAALLILVAGLVYVYVRRGRNNTIAAVMPVLKEDEKTALRFMIERDGECEQKEMVEELDYSKAKISRLVKDLEERNLIEKIKEGRKNRLVLKKEVGDVEFDGD